MQAMSRRATVSARQRSVSLFRIVELNESMLKYLVSGWVLALVVVTQVGAHGNEHALPIELPSAPVSIVSSESEAAGGFLEPAWLSNEPTVSPVIESAAPVTMSPVLGGSWSPVYDWPIVAIHAALLPNGKVLSWDATPDDADEDPHTNDNNTTRVTLWDPRTNTHVATNNNTDTDLFCAGSAHLWDGRILFAGGDAGKGGANAPLSNTNIYDPDTNTWRRAANMNAPRWYSSVAALANGEMLTLGGSAKQQLVSEVFQFDQTWRPLTNANPTSLDGWWLVEEDNGASLAYDYQWIQAAPDGSVISFGPQNLLASVDTQEDGGWTDGPPRDSAGVRDYGSYAMFDVGKILVAGGGNSERTAVVVDANTRQTTDTSPMNIGRRQHNLTILADGSVLVTGGNTDGARYYSPTGGTKTPEIWNPQTGRFTEVNPMQGDRQYHSIALLLPDGRVLSGGGGICGDCYRLGYEERNAEIFTPPYLYAGDASLANRPLLQNAASAANYAQTLTVTTNTASVIEKAHLIKLGSTTHSENQDQRLVPISFSQTGSTVRLPMPESRNVAPPGHYLLFLVNSAGVPSVGSMIKLGQPLVSVDEAIVNTLEASATHTYAYDMSRGDWVSTITADAPVKLLISEAPPNASGIPSSPVCESVAQAGNSQSCTVSVSSPSTWYVTVTGAERTEYRLNSRLDPISQDAPDSPPIDQRVSTGGSMSLFFLLIVMLWGTLSLQRASNKARLTINQ